MRHAFRTNTAKTSHVTMARLENVQREPYFSSGELCGLSEWLIGIQKIFHKHQYEKLYVGGSSAREILDHILFDDPLELRDLDIYLIKGGMVGPQDVEALASEIEALKLASRGVEKMRPKLRANAKFPKPQCYEYVAGFGAHMFAAEQPILSLGIFNSENDLDLNGIFSFDNIFLCLSNHQSLADFAQHVFDIGPMYEELRNLDLVLDKHYGYEAWRQRNPLILNWIEIERAFVRHSLRIVRSYAKVACLTLSEDFVSEFKLHDITGSTIDNHHEFGRGLIKIFADRYWAYELKMLAQLGVLRAFSFDLEALVARHSSEEIQEWGAELAIDADPLKRACERAKIVLKRVESDQKQDLLPQLLTLAPSAFGAH